MTRASRVYPVERKCFSIYLYNGIKLRDRVKDVEQNQKICLSTRIVAPQTSTMFYNLKKVQFRETALFASKRLKSMFISLSTFEEANSFEKNVENVDFSYWCNRATTHYFSTFMTLWATHRPLFNVHPKSRATNDVQGGTHRYTRQ